MSQQPAQVQNDMIWTEFIHAHTHTHTRGLTWGVMGLLDIQLGNVISWRSSTDIHIVQISVCLCVCWPVLWWVGFIRCDRKDDQYVRRLSLSKETSLRSTHCLSRLLYVLGGFIVLDGQQLTNNKLDNCELIKRSIIYIAPSVFVTTEKRSALLEEVVETCHCNEQNK